MDVLVYANGEDLLQDVDGRGAKPAFNCGLPVVDLFLEGVGGIPDWEMFLHLYYISIISTIHSLLLIKYFTYSING